MIPFTIRSAALALALAAPSTAQVPLFHQKRDRDGQQFGWSVGRAGDVNRDGFADVIVGMHLDSVAAPWAEHCDTRAADPRGSTLANRPSTSPPHSIPKRLSARIMKSTKFCSSDPPRLRSKTS